METWMTAAEIAARYFVGEERLLAYGQRGNLAWRRLADGTTLFDEKMVAKIFRPRRASIASFRIPEGPSMGVLGVTKIGEKPEEGTSGFFSRDARAERRRGVRITTSREPVAIPSAVPTRKLAG